MKHPSYFYIGRISRAHGLEGAVEALLDVSEPKRYQQEKTLFLEQNGKLIPYPVLQFNLSGSKAILSLEDINTPAAAAELAGLELFLPEHLLPQLDESRFYLHELIGLKLEDEALGALGTITEIQERPGQPLALLETQSGEQILIPAIPELLYRIDREAKIIYSRLPEGLIDLNA